VIFSCVCRFLCCMFTRSAPSLSRILLPIQREKGGDKEEGQRAGLSFPRLLLLRQTGSRQTSEGSPVAKASQGTRTAADDELFSIEAPDGAVPFHCRASVVQMLVQEERILERVHSGCQPAIPLLLLKHLSTRHRRSPGSWRPPPEQDLNDGLSAMEW